MVLDHILCEWWWRGIILSNCGLFWVRGGGWGLFWVCGVGLGCMGNSSGWVRVGGTLFWAGGSGWR